MNPKKFSLGGGISAKNWTAYILFGAIIVVMAFFGITPAMDDAGTGGVAAVVNDNAISLAEYRGQVERIEQNARMRFDQFPEAQRKQLSQELRRRVLEELIREEAVYQTAANRGVIASDAQVRAYILEVPFFQENGRFLKDRYRAFLQNMNFSSEEFERQIRKQIVREKLQELFVGSAAPTREELKRSRMLANQKVNIRFAEFTKEDLMKASSISDAEVQQYLTANKAEVEKYYKDNTVEFSSPEKVKARHILIRIDEKQNEAAAKKLAEDLRKQATPQNFAALATKHSDDPGSKNKGGDLGEFDRGRMVPAFEETAFKQEAGKISDPVKTDFGYHIIFTEAKVPATTQPLEQAQADIARKMIGRSREAELVAKAREAVEKGTKAEVDALVQRSGSKWQESGEFDLSSSTIPKLGDSQAVIRAILKQGKGGGLIRQLVDSKGNYVVAELLSWKEVPDTNPEVEGLERMVAFRKSNDLIETWAREVEARASIQRNPRLLQ